MASKKLFRKEAIEAQQVKWMGGIVLIRPFSFTVITLFAIAFAVILLSFFFFASYTKRTTVSGQLIPSSGVIRIYSLDTGIVTEKRVSEGQQVKQGDTLFVLSTTRFDEHGDQNRSVLDTIESRASALNDEKVKVQAIHLNDVQQLSTQRQGLNADLQKVQRLIHEQQKRIALAQSNVERYKGLLHQEYISVDEFQVREDNLISQQLSLQGYEREQINKRNELTTIDLQLQSIANKQRNEVLALERQISSVEQEKIQNQAQRNVVVLAQATGIATAINAEVGQQIVTNTPMVNIMPQQSQLEAHLYIPSEAIGFIKKDQQVKLRYQAFPYQRFGQAQGRVISIADSAMNISNIVNLGELSGTSTEGDKAIYVVKVALDQQAIQAYGHAHALKMGMAFEADIMQENRKLYEWVLEPLFSITGKL